jgi:transcriptional regulator with XRE-family HTH domain
MQKKLHGQIASRIRELLIQRGKSAEKLAYEIGISKQMLYYYLSGKRGARLETLEKISKGLDVRIKDLFPD